MFITNIAVVFVSIIQKCSLVVSASLFYGSFLLLLMYASPFSFAFSLA